MNPDVPFERDAGLPAERSSLAWQRTVLGVTLGSVLAGTSALHVGHWWIAVGALVVAAGAVWPGVLRPRKDRTLAAGSPAGSPAGPLAGALVRDGWSLLFRAAGLVVALALVGVALAIVGMVT